MTCTLYLVVSTSLLSDSLSGLSVPRSVCSLVSLMFLLPCLLLTDLRLVSTLSLLCSLAHILIRWLNKRGSESVSLSDEQYQLTNSQVMLNNERKSLFIICFILTLVNTLQLVGLRCLLPPATHCCYWLTDSFLMPGVLPETKDIELGLEFLQLLENLEPSDHTFVFGY